LIVFAGFIAISGVLLLQWNWMAQALQLKTQAFDRDVRATMAEVCDMISIANGNKPDLSYPILQTDDETYVANVNDFIDTVVLRHYLEKYLARAGLDLGYEYAVYDCSSADYVYRKTVGLNPEETYCVTAEALDNEVDYLYYFAVRFPDKQSYLFKGLGPWNLIALLVVIVLFFFAYTVWILLRQRRFSEVQRDFINNMTHEFKTPISTITVSSEALKKGDMAVDKSKTYAEIIWEEAQRLNRQVEKVLDVAKSEKRNFELSKRMSDVHQIMNKATEKIRAAHRLENGNLECHLTAEHHWIELDPLHFGNVVFNLLDNAIKYRREELHIQLRSFDRKKELILEFEDEGIGIEPHLIPRIFQKFYRVSTGNVHDVKGFGLGLYYVHQIVKAHGWKIEVESESNKGSIFRLIIPHS
jgi:two-component system phosphate regulon sensor histidine kinase PhoR